MKKARFMLSAIGIFAVLATAFAFKAKTFENNFIYTGTLNSGVCTVKVEGAKITTSGGTQVAASVSSLTENCLNRITTTTFND